jgi:multiple sugar transport system substrate-binding protein
MRRTTGRLLRGMALLSVLALGATACGGSDDDSSSTKAVSAADIQAALKKGGSVTVWAWEPTLKTVAADFQKKYPKVKINLVSDRSGDKHYTALSNAIAAGKGVPDVAQVEYFALSQYSLTKGLTDLAPYGADKLASKYTAGPWNAVSDGSKVYGLPMDSGPMAMFYNKKVFDKYKIAVPTTWDEYVVAARKLHKADPKAYIANDAGDAGFTTSMLWQAGSRPYKVDGTKVTVNFEDAGAKKYTETWQKLIDEKLLAPINGWTDDWYKGLGDGTIATLTTGAWMPANFVSGVAGASGDWRAAPPSPCPRWARTRNSRTRSSSTPTPAPASRPVSTRAPSRRPRRSSSRRRSRTRSSRTSAGRRPTRSSPSPRPRSLPTGRTCPSSSTPTRSSTTPSARPTSRAPRWLRV